MTPDRMRGWLRKIPTGSKRVALVVEAVSGYEAVADWTREEIDDMGKDPELDDIASAISAQAQDYTNAEDEKKKFLIRWIGQRNRVLRTCTHWCDPVAPKKGDNEGEISDAIIIKTLMAALATKDARLETSLQVITEGFKTTITMLNEQVKILFKQVNEDMKKEALVPVPVELTAEQAEEVLQRTEALKALNLKLPDVIDLAIAAAAQAWLDPVDEEPGKGKAKH